jgi:hypothetical protein
LPGGQHFSALTEALGKVLLVARRSQVDTSKLEAAIQKMRVTVDESRNHQPSWQFQQNRLLGSPLKDLSFASDRCDAICFDSDCFDRRQNAGGRPKPGFGQDEVSLTLGKQRKATKAKPQET